MTRPEPVARPVPTMILVGSTGSRLGKTALTARIIEALAPREKVVGVKVTTIRDRREKCPRGGDGCGVCSSLEGDFEIVEETDAGGGKDTARLLRAGAARVFWLKAMREALAAGLDALLARIDREAVIVAESNSLRHVVRPGVFLMLRETEGDRIKPTAREVLPFADIVVPSVDGVPAVPVSDILERYYSSLTAIVLAGGASRRMGRDKALLPVGGRPMIRALIDSLAPIVGEVIVSLSDGGRHDALRRALPAGVRVVYDERPGQGPLMGIFAGLKASGTDVNLVVACDIPEVPPGFVTLLRSYAGDHDVVVPVDREGRMNALLAVYNKSVLPLIEEQLKGDLRKIVLFYPRCRVKTVPLPDATWVRNINTLDDYRKYRLAAKA